MPARCRPSHHHSPSSRRCPPATKDSISHHHLLSSKRCPPVTKDSVLYTDTPTLETCFGLTSMHTSPTSAAHTNGNSPTTLRLTRPSHLMTNQPHIPSVHPPPPQPSLRRVQGLAARRTPRSRKHSRLPDTLPHPQEVRRWTGPCRDYDRLQWPL